jgi:1-acyl-sn-glycerol-3-phosphate acyltransferase
VLDRYHHRTLTKRPWLQGLLFAALSPILLVAARVRIRGREHIPEGGFILTANHPSVLDAFFVAVGLGRRVRFMAKSELFTRRWGRWLARAGAFPVRRGVWDQDAFATASGLLADGKVLVMFWEGGLSPAEGYRAPKPGIGHIAQLAGATVLPCHLDGTRALRRRPWSWPRIVVTYGPPLVIEQDPEPTRERNAAVAERIAAAVIDLKDS